MFFTITNLQSLIIDTDDFRSDQQLLIDIVQSLDLALKVQLVTRSNRPHEAFQQRTTRPRNTTEHLKYSALLKRMITEANLPPASTAFLCTSRLTLELAKPLLLGTVVYKNKLLSDGEKLLLYQESPDFVVDSLDSLLRCLSINDNGYLAETTSSDRVIKSMCNYSSPAIATTSSRSPLRTTTSNSPDALTPPHAPEQTTRIVRLPNLEYQDCPFFVMGRYFGPADPRHQIHPLSLRILKFKRQHTPHSKLFTDAFQEAIPAATGGAYDVITQVPSRPEVGDRFAYLLTKLQENIAHADSIQTDVLRCVKSYPSLKGLNPHARKSNFAQVFKVQKDIAGKRIVLIDDIVTTGSTANACIKELKAAGAASVTCVFLAYHPFALRAYNFEHPSCTTCGEPVDVKFESPLKICFVCHNDQDSETVHSNFSFEEILATRIHIP